VVSLFRKKSAGWIGVDIGSSSVKLVALSRSGRDTQIDSYAIVHLPAGAVVDGKIEIPHEVSSAVERGLKICGGRYSHAVVSVPSSAVITKRLQINNLFTGIDLEDQVKVEADQFIPYPLEEVALDFEVLGPVAKDPNLNEILIVACRKESSESREEAVVNAGLKCGVIDVDTYSMERMLSLLEPKSGEKLHAVVDLGASTLGLNVFKNGNLVYNREQAFSGADLSASIQQSYSMSHEEAELSLRENSFDKEVYESLIEPYTDTVAQHVSRALQFFYSSGIHGQLDKCYLAGGVSGIPHLCNRLEEELGIRAVLTDPFTNMLVSPRLNQERLHRVAPMLAKACGLALRSFDQ